MKRLEYLDALVVVMNNLLLNCYPNASYRKFSKQIDKKLIQSHKHINDILYYSKECDKNLFNKNKIKDMIEHLEDEISELKSVTKDLEMDGRDLPESTIDKVFEELADCINLIVKIFLNDEIDYEKFDILYDSTKITIGKTLDVLLSYKHGFDIPTSILNHLYIKYMELYVASICKQELESKGKNLIAQSSIIGGVHIGSVIGYVYDKRSSDEIDNEMKKILKEIRTVFKSKLNYSNASVITCWKDKYI